MNISILNEKGLHESIELKEDRWAWLYAGMSILLVFGYITSTVIFLFS